MVKPRSRLVVWGAVLVLVAALLPAGLAAGTGGGGSDPTIIYLTLGRSDHVKFDGAKQGISSGRHCAVSFAASPQLLIVTPSGGPLGLVKDGLGVKSSSDGTGEPCGRVEASKSEALSVALGSGLDGFLMSAIDLDMELKFDALVEVSFRKDGNSVGTPFVFNPSDTSDDGPDSGDGDNFRLKFGPVAGFLFDEVVLRPTAGSLSLEGGADGTESGSLDSGNNSSQFKVVPSLQIDCDEPETIEEGNVTGVVNMEALHEGGGFNSDCVGTKTYEQDVTEGEGDEGTLTFTPSGGSPARFTLILTIENQTISSGGELSSLAMTYDNLLGGGPRPLRSCLKDAQGLDFEQSPLGLLPGTETACFYQVEVTPTGEDVGTEVWSIYFEDDPVFAF